MFPGVWVRVLRPPPPSQLEVGGRLGPLSASGSLPKELAGGSSDVKELSESWGGRVCAHPHSCTYAQVQRGECLLRRV